MQTELSQRLASKSRRRLLAGAAAAAAVIAVMALDTKVVEIESAEDLRKQAFSPDAYAKEEFPRIRSYVLEHAVEAQTLWQAIQADKKAASEKYGVDAGIAPIFPVAFTGTVANGKNGIYYVNVDGLPDKPKIRVQTGPAINGTEIRDATGTIEFGHFKNQIEYQDVGAALNRAMKADVLAPIDTTALTGKTVEVTGVFTMINPENWLVTPVRFEVQ